MMQQYFQLYRIRAASRYRLVMGMKIWHVGMLIQVIVHVPGNVNPSFTRALKETKTISSQKRNVNLFASVSKFWISKWWTICAFNQTFVLHIVQSISIKFLAQCINPCGGNNTMLLEPTGIPRQCGPTWPCPNTHWCHVGGNVDTTVCCSGC